MQTLIISFLVFILSINLSAQDIWEQTNGPTGTPILNFAINSDNHLLAGGPSLGVTRHGGVFYSTDNGNYWSQIGLANVSTNALTFNSSGLIFAGNENGIYRTYDYGENWIHLPSMPFDTRTLTIENNNNILAGTEYGIYRSTDNGDSWIDLNNGIPLGFNVKSVAINSNGHIFICGRKWSNPYSEYSIYSSTNNGENWTRLNFSFLVNSLIIDSNDYIYAGTTSNGVFRSINDGNTWIQKINGLTNQTVNSLVMNSSNSIFAGTEDGVFYSTNNGDNWVEITNDLPIHSVKSLIAISINYFLAGTNNGVYLSSNNGTNWSMSNKGFANTDFRSLAINQSGNIFGGTWGDGVFYSTNNGDDWIQRNNGLQSSIILSLAINSNGDVFAGGAYGVFRSSNNGQNWILKGLNDHIIISLVINSNGHIFCGAYKSVFRSTDNGENWIEVSNGFTDSDVGSLATNSSGHIFAGTRGDGIFRSTDNGNTWTEINNGLYPLYGSAFAINSFEDIFVCASNVVFRSTDNGNNWVQTSLSAPYLSSVAIDSIDRVYVGSDAYGVYRSTDNGENWSEYNDGLTYKTVSSLVISDDYIFAGAVYGGVFKRSIYTTSVEDENRFYPVTYSLSQNYPNPFNPSTTIKYQIPELSFVTIKVYDVLGNEIETLVDEEKAIGNYNVEFNSANLSSGIYLYKLKAGQFLETKKMILLK